MRRVALFAVIGFFVMTALFGIIAARSGEERHLFLFRLFFVLFLLASSLLLLNEAPLWVAAAPMVPVLVFILILFSAGKWRNGS
jgi:hypothetical protein